MLRTGLSGKTLSAEGVWNASTGQACMVACRGAGRTACDFRVCLFFPTTLSITRMDTMLGLIYGVDAAGRVAQPPLLSFRQRIGPPRLWGDYTHDGKPLVPYKYNYTKVQQAVELRKRSVPPFDWRKIVPQSLHLSYPKIDDASDEMRSLSTLADRLILIFLTVPVFFRHESVERPVLYSSTWRSSPSSRSLIAIPIRRRDTGACREKNLALRGTAGYSTCRRS
ncbi:hypothetical protein ACQ4PT_010732 [Festuca glaucescens]